MLKVGIIGCGAIGTLLAKAITDGKAGECRLVALFDKVDGRAKKLSLSLSNRPFAAKTFGGFLRAKQDLIVEAASQDAVKEYGTEALGRANLMIMSVGALLNDKLLESLKRAAKNNKRKIYVPSGSICGVDGVKAAGVGKIESAELITRKPPKGFDLITKKKKLLYDGPAEKAVVLYPKNVNVAATLSLAGIGKKKTRVRIIADPSVTKNVHEIILRGEFGELRAKTSNIQCPSNPRTSYIAALSAVRAIRSITEVLVIGT